MRYIILTIMIVTLSGCNQPWHADGIHTGPGTIIEAEATYPWSDRSKLLLGGMVAAHYLDYETSRRMNFGEPINSDGSGGMFYETNMLLGKTPSDSDLALFKGGVVLGTVLLCEILPEHRDIILICSGAIGGVCATRNHRLYEQHK